MSTVPDAPVERRAARVLLLDDSDRVLLFRGVDPRLDEDPFWFTPGGGLDPGETLQQAAHRELREETGCTTADLGPAVWTRWAEFDMEGVSYRQHETFFLARVPSWEVDTAGFTELERRIVHRHHWWTLDELHGTRERIYPIDLARLLAALLREGPPLEVLEVGE